MTDVVASWVHELTRQRTDATFTVVDLAEVNLPLFDEQIPSRAATYSRPHTLRWAETVSGFDGFAFVRRSTTIRCRQCSRTRSTSATPSGTTSGRIMPRSARARPPGAYRSLRSSLATGFIGYGADGGTRAVEQLRQIMTEVRVAGVGGQVSLSFFDDFVDYRDPDGQFTPHAHQEEALSTMLDELVGWSGALARLHRTRSA